MFSRREQAGCVQRGVERRCDHRQDPGADRVQHLLPATESPCRTAYTGAERSSRGGGAGRQQRAAAAGGGSSDGTIAESNSIRNSGWKEGQPQPPANAGSAACSSGQPTSKCEAVRQIALCVSLTWPLKHCLGVMSSREQAEGRQRADRGQTERAGSRGQAAESRQQRAGSREQGGSAGGQRRGFGPHAERRRTAPCAASLSGDPSL